MNICGKMKGKQKGRHDSDSWFRKSSTTDGTFWGTYLVFNILLYLQRSVLEQNYLLRVIAL